MSVIIPAYRVEKWIVDCLDSVRAQTYEYFEAIIVDDGSDDKTLQLAKEFASRDPRFKVVSQENQGLAGSRNTGVNQATGDYLFFLDSDDLLVPCALEKLVSAAEKTNADLVIADFTRFSDGEPIPDTSLLKPQVELLRLQEKLSSGFKKAVSAYEMWALESNYLTVQPGKLFSFKAWRESGAMGLLGLRMAEDFLPTRTFLINASVVHVLPETLYLYRRRPGSNTSRRTLNALDIFSAYHHAREMFEKNGAPKLALENLTEVYIRWAFYHLVFFLDRSGLRAFDDALKTVVTELETEAPTQSNQKLSKIAIRCGKFRYPFSLLSFILSAGLTLAVRRIGRIVDQNLP